MSFDGFILGILEEWDDQPGGTIKKRFTQDGVEYVYVEFENSPGKWYLYYA